MYNEEFGVETKEKSKDKELVEKIRKELCDLFYHHDYNFEELANYAVTRCRQHDMQMAIDVVREWIKHTDIVYESYDLEGAIRKAFKEERFSDEVL